MPVKKRVGIDALISQAEMGEADGRVLLVEESKNRVEQAEEMVAPKKKEPIIKHSIYLLLSADEQLRDLVLEEQRGNPKKRKMHDYFLEAIDLLFKSRGLKPMKGRE